MERPVITVTAPDGTPLAHVTVHDGAARVSPPEAAAHPLVAAVVRQVEATARRPRRRASC